MPGVAVSGDLESDDSQTRRLQIEEKLHQARLWGVGDLTYDGVTRVDVAQVRETARYAREFWDYFATAATRADIASEYPEVFDTTEVRPSGPQNGNRRRLDDEYAELYSRRYRHDATEHARLLELETIRAALTEVDGRAAAMGMPVHLVSYPAAGDVAKALVVEIGDRKVAAGHQVWFVPQDAANYSDLYERVDDFTDLAEAENVPGRSTSIIGVLRYGGAAGVDVVAGTAAVAEGMLHRIITSRVLHEQRAPYQSPPTVEIAHRGDGSSVWAAVADRLRAAAIDTAPWRRSGSGFGHCPVFRIWMCAPPNPRWSPLSGTRAPPTTW